VTVAICFGQPSPAQIRFACDRLVRWRDGKPKVVVGAF
jgi:hypothetical protein